MDLWLWLAIPSVSPPFPGTAFFLDKRNFVLCNPNVVSHSTGHPGCFLVAFFVLGICLIRDAPTSSPLSFSDFHSFSCPSRHLSSPSSYLILNPSNSPPHLLPYAVHSLHVSLMTILFPLLSEIQESSLVPSFLCSFSGSMGCSTYLSICTIST